MQSVYRESFDLDDIRAMCHSKDHDCATYVDHPEFGLGKPVYESHAMQMKTDMSHGMMLSSHMVLKNKYP